MESHECSLLAEGREVLSCPGFLTVLASLVALGDELGDQGSLSHWALDTKLLSLEDWAAGNPGLGQQPS